MEDSEISTALAQIGWMLSKIRSSDPSVREDIKVVKVNYRGKPRAMIVNAVPSGESHIIEPLALVLSDDDKDILEEVAL